MSLNQGLKTWSVLLYIDSMLDKCATTQCFIALMNYVLSPCQLVVDYNISCACSI